MAKHHHHHHRSRHNPFGVSGTLVKDAALNVAGFAGANWGASFLAQSGWLDVLATAGAGVAISFAGKSIAGASASEELLKGAIVAAIIKAIKQTGVAVPGLSMYVPTYFSAPTASDPYGRAQAPTIMLPAPAPGKGVAGLGYASGGGKFRSRFFTRY